MGVSSAKFESAGQVTEHYIHGAYSRRNTVGAGSGVSSGNLAILGVSTGGKPLTLHCVKDKADAKDLLVEGDLLTAVAHAFNGSNEFIPSKVYCMRVNNGTQGSRTLYSGNSEILKIYSKDYGSHTNQIKLWFKEEGSSSYKVSISYKGSEVSVSGIQKKSFSVIYTGSGESSYCETNKSVEGVKLYAYDEALSKIDEVTILSEECSTIDELVSRINDTGCYSATVLDNGGEASLVSELDTSSMDITSASRTFYSNLKALCDALESIQ